MINIALQLLIGDDLLNIHNWIIFKLKDENLFFDKNPLNEKINIL